MISKQIKKNKSIIFYIELNIKTVLFQTIQFHEKKYSLDMRTFVKLMMKK